MDDNKDMNKKTNKKNDVKSNSSIEDKIEKNSRIKLIPAIIQDHKTKEVLMLAYMSKESLERSIKTGTTWFWSRKREKLWNKGESSGNIQKIKKIEYDCDGDTLLIKVEQVGNACHTGERSCFFRSLDIETRDLEKINWDDLDFSYNYGESNRSSYEINCIDSFKVEESGQESTILNELYRVIEDRIESKTPNSYTYSLHKKGLDEILKKIGEESIEVVLSSKHQKRERVISEIADLFYHLIVLMVEKKIAIDEVFRELRSRRK